ncbi:unnamed protein product, partial [Staurois parvus]
MGPPTDPGPSGSARVSKWSVRPCSASSLTTCQVLGGHHMMSSKNAPSRVPPLVRTW